MSIVTLGFIEATAAGVTATAAVGLYREGRAVRRAVLANEDRSRAADERSTGNRRYLRWLVPRVLGADDYRAPSEFDPEGAARTDGGSENA